MFYLGKFRFSEIKIFLFYKQNFCFDIHRFRDRLLETTCISNSRKKIYVKAILQKITCSFVRKQL